VNTGVIVETRDSTMTAVITGSVYRAPVSTVRYW